MKIIIELTEKELEDLIKNKDSNIHNMNDLLEINKKKIINENFLNQDISFIKINEDGDTLYKLD